MTRHLSLHPRPPVLAVLLLFLLLLAACRDKQPAVEPADGAAPSGSAAAPRFDMGDGWAESDALKAKLAPDVPADLSDTFRSKVVKLVPVDAPYLAKSEIYRATRTFRVGAEVVHHPSTWLLSRAPGRGLHNLTTRDDWMSLRKEDGLRLDTEPRRIAYVRAFVQAVGRTEHRYDWIADSVEQLQLFTSADADAMPRAHDEAEAARARALETKYRSIIKPLALPGAHPPFTGAVFVNGTGQKIIRVDVQLAADGDITLTDNVLEKNAPIPMVF